MCLCRCLTGEEVSLLYRWPHTQLAANRGNIKPNCFASSIYLRVAHIYAFSRTISMFMNACCIIGTSLLNVTCSIYLICISNQWITEFNLIIKFHSCDLPVLWHCCQTVISHIHLAVFSSSLQLYPTII